LTALLSERSLKRRTLSEDALSRHTSASTATISGRFLRHSDLWTTMIYTHVLSRVAAVPFDAF
jgi:uncharacterized protein YerC